MSSQPVTSTIHRIWPATAALLAFAIVTGTALFPSHTLVATCLLAAFLAGSLLSPFLMFGLYYAISQTVVGLQLPFLPVSLNQMVFMAFLGAIARQTLDRKLRIPNSWPLWSMIALGSIMTLSALTGVSNELGRMTAKSIVTLSIVSVALALLIKSKAEVQLVFWAFLIPTMLNGAVGAVEAILNTGFFETKVHLAEGFFRINGVSPNSIVLAQSCLFALPMALYLARHGRNRLQHMAAVFCAGFLLAITARTFNFQNLIIAPVIVVSAAALFRGQLARRLLLGCAVAALLAVPFLFPIMNARLQRIHSGTDESMRLRMDNAINAMQVYKSHPWFGAGLGSFPDAWWSVRSMDTYINQYEEIPRQQEVDQIYFLLLAETGIIGFAINIVFYLAMIAFIWRARAKHRNDPPVADFAAVLLIIWVQYLASGLTQDAIFHMRTWLLFGMSAALVNVVACRVPSDKPAQFP